MKTPAIPEGDLLAGPEDESLATKALAVSEADDLKREISKLRVKGSRHMLWAALGFSPAAILPAIGLLGEGSDGLLLVLVGLVTLTQAYLWTRAKRDVRRLEEQLDAVEQDDGIDPR